jgi:nicotinamide-nucleotide amidase
MSTNHNNMRVCIDKTAQNVVQLLKDKKLTLAAAESCTGGLLSAAVTETAGASSVFGFGLCAYANEIKTRMLGVSPLTLQSFGAVSAQCAREMALGAQRASGAAVSVSVTGIAGPAGGSGEKPVGTVYIVCAYENKTNVLHLQIQKKERAYIRNESVRQALILILNTIN